MLNLSDFSTELFLDVARWTAIADGGLLLVTLVAFGFGWGWRFRLVGATAFTGVLAAGLVALSLSLVDRPQIPGAGPYKLVYDTGSSQVVVAVAPEVDRDTLAATLQQAAIDLYSPGRVGPKPTLTVIARSVVHPQPGVSKLVYRGKIERSLSVKVDKNPTIKLYP